MRCVLLTHETSRVCGICANLAVDFDESLCDNRGNFMSSQGVLQPISQENGKGKGLPEFVWSRRRAGCLYYGTQSGVPSRTKNVFRT